MFESLLAILAKFITSVISGGGYAGIAGLMGIESACIPLPSEIIMPFAGYLVSTGRFNLLAVATAGAIGCNIGSTLAYAVGYIGGRPLIERWGKYIFLSKRELAIVDGFFDRYGAVTVFICRLLPVVRTYIALPAGITRMNQVKFQIYTFIGSWPWCYGLAYIGMKLGEQWDKNPELKRILHSLDAVIIAVLMLMAGRFVWGRLKRPRQ